MIHLSKVFLIIVLGLAACSSRPVTTPQQYLNIPNPPNIEDYLDRSKTTDYDGLMTYLDALENYRLTVKEHEGEILRKYFKHPYDPNRKENCVSLFYRDKIKISDPPNIDGMDLEQVVDLLTSYVERLHSDIHEYNASVDRTNEIQSSLCESR
jgi:hypothetical protein